MEFTLASLGMVLIIVSWIIQIGFTLKRGKAMRPCFAGLQFIGIVLLVVDSFQFAGEMTSMAWLNVLSALGALGMLILLFRK